MELPSPLAQALRELATQSAPKALDRPAAQLIARYRNGQATSKAHQATPNDALAYAIARMPATYGATRSALSAIRQVMPEFAPKTVLDVGSGPGTAIWATIDTFPSVDQVFAVERESAMIALGKRLIQYSPSRAMQDTTWVHGPIEHDVVTHYTGDMTIAAYLVGELDSSVWIPLIEKLWERTQQVLTVIEPGTPAGFTRIREIRSKLVSIGAHIVAPCPHCNVCPLSATDWCHFSTRIARSQLQKRLKGGQAPYEDEKFSYIALSKAKVPSERSPRVIRHPRRDPGRITLNLCTDHGLETKIITKKTPPAFRIARKIQWGDQFIEND